MSMIIINKVKFKSNRYNLKDVYKKLSVPQFTIVTGLFIIFVGTLILSSPLCSSSKVGLWEAFFTSTSAITVTGLTIIDIGVDLNFFGQVFLAFMLLSGGLGLMAITTFLQGFVVKGTKLRTRLDKGKKEIYLYESEAIFILDEYKVLKHLAYKSFREENYSLNFLGAYS